MFPLCSHSSCLIKELPLDLYTTSAYGYERELADVMAEAFADVTGIESVRMTEETHRPDLWEHLDWEDAIGFDFRAWESGRTNHQRAVRT